MKAQDAYDVLEKFLRKYDAGLAEREALKSLAAYVKTVQTRDSRKSRIPEGSKSPKNGTNKPQYFDNANKGKTGKGSPWTPEEDKRLQAEYKACLDGYQMGALHERTVEAVAARLQFLGVLSDRDLLPGYVEYRDKKARERGGRYYPGQYKSRNK